MGKIICDRDGLEYDEKDDIIIKVIGNGFIKYHICLNCWENFRLWINPLK